MLQAKADALWENQSYREAGDLYGEARSRFEDAQGLAHRSLLEAEAQAAAIKAREAREVAVREGVEEHAADVFWEAVRAERRGDTSMGQGDFAAARDLYLAAVEQYAGARQQAQRARQRQAALAAQAEADAVRRALSLAGAAEEAAYRQGQEAQREGDAHLAAEAFEVAAATYATARGRFQQASASWQRRRAEEARARAVQAGERFPKDFAKTLDGLARGGCRGRGRCIRLRRGGLRGGRRALVATGGGCPGIAGPGTGRGRAGTTRCSADPRGRVARLGGQGLGGCRPIGTRGRAGLAGATLRRGHRSLEWALRAYTEASAAAEAARDEQQAVEARTQAEQSESAARAAGAPQFAQARFAKATSAHQEGARDLQNRHWEEARRHYAEAHRLYLEAREEAERARARAAAEAALESARAARAALQQAARSEDLLRAHRASGGLVRGGPDGAGPRALGGRPGGIRHERHPISATARGGDRPSGAGGRGPGTGPGAAPAAGHRRGGWLAHGARQGRLGTWASPVRSGELRGGPSQLREGGVTLRGPAAGRRSTQARAPPRGAVGQGAALPRARRTRGRRRVLLHAGGAGARTSGTPETRGPGGGGAAAESSRLHRPRNHSGSSRAPMPARRSRWPRGRPRPLRSRSRVRSRDRCAIPGSSTTRPRCTGRQGEGPTWSYTPDFDAAGERLKEIKVVVSDADAVKAEIRWRVKVLDTNRPPRLVAAMPTTQTLTVKSGETVRFSVQGEDPDRDDALAYVWSLDGARMAEGERFDLKSGTPGARQRVEVAVVDRAGLSERRSWEIAVEAPPPLPPLAIRAASPKVAPGQELVLTEGQSQTFSIEVAGGDPAALEYVWQLDGKKQATGSRWTYKAPASASRTKELRVVVSGGAGPPLEHLWRIRVNPANRPPTIVAFTPTDTRIEVARGTAQRFTVEATDADEAIRSPIAGSWMGGRSRREAPLRWTRRSPRDSTGSRSR